MKKICWWLGTDALTLVKYPPGTFIWHVKLFFYRIKWRLLMRFFDEHWVDAPHLGDYLKKYGVKKFKVVEDDSKYGKLEKKKHSGFNALYYCPSKPHNLGGMKYIHWVYGFDVFVEIKKSIPDINFIHVDGSSDLKYIYPVIDVFIHPNRHDGHSRMITECNLNDIPVIKSVDFNPDVQYFINEINKIK